MKDDQEESLGLASGALEHAHKLGDAVDQQTDADTDSRNHDKLRGDRTSGRTERTYRRCGDHVSPPPAMQELRGHADKETDEETSTGGVHDA
jgi:hypothetical protein